MMKQRISIFLLFTILLSASGYAQKGIMRLTQQTLMHEVRETPSPLNGQHITVNPPRFMWPDSSRTSVLYWTELKKRTTNPK